MLKYLPALAANSADCEDGHSRRGLDEFPAAVREWDESKKGGASQFRPREYPLCDIAMLNDIGHRGTKGNGFSPRPMQRGF
jgi:hypothetical protein